MAHKGNDAHIASGLPKASSPKGLHDFRVAEAHKKMCTVGSHFKRLVSYLKIHRKSELVSYILSPDLDALPLCRAA